MVKDIDEKPGRKGLNGNAPEFLLAQGGCLMVLPRKCPSPALKDLSVIAASSQKMTFLTKQDN